MLDIGISILETTNAENVIEKFIKKCDDYSKNNESVHKDELHPHIWERLKDKDRKFLLDNMSVIFGDEYADKIDMFLEFIETKDKNGKLIVNEDQEEEMWDIIHGMIRIVIGYIHERREPGEIEKEVNGKVIKTQGYTKKYFSDFSIKKLSERWGLTK